MGKCKYQITVTSPSLLSGATASLNNLAVRMIEISPRKFQSDEVERESDGENKIEIDVHARGKKFAGVTVKVKNVTSSKEIFNKSGIFGSDGNPSTQYNFIDEKVDSTCA